MLYAAPQDGTTPVDAVVETVRPASRSGVIADGGHRVTVGLHTGGTKIGSVIYAHIEPSVSQGATISCWNTQLGVVGNYTPSSCWTGPHVHVELYSQHNYACYNGTWAPGQASRRPTSSASSVGLRLRAASGLPAAICSSSCFVLGAEQLDGVS